MMDRILQAQRQSFRSMSIKSKRNFIALCNDAGTALASKQERMKYPHTFYCLPLSTTNQATVLLGRLCFRQNMKLLNHNKWYPLINHIPATREVQVQRILSILQFLNTRVLDNNIALAVPPSFLDNFDNKIILSHPSFAKSHQCSDGIAHYLDTVIINNKTHTFPEKTKLEVDNNCSLLLGGEHCHCCAKGGAGSMYQTVRGEIKCQI